MSSVCSASLARILSPASAPLLARSKMSRRKWKCSPKIALRTGPPLSPHSSCLLLSLSHKPLPLLLRIRRQPIELVNVITSELSGRKGNQLLVYLIFLKQSWKMGASIFSLECLDDKGLHFATLPVADREIRFVNLFCRKTYVCSLSGQPALATRHLTKRYTSSIETRRYSHSRVTQILLPRVAFWAS